MSNEYATSFQSESKKTGDAFESVVLLDLTERKFSTIFQNVEIEDTGCEVDFIAKSWQTTEYVEAKGGLHGEKKRPGAKRTDNVKKAIANGALIKSVHPDSYYVVYFSSEPEPGSYSDKMLKAAKKANFIDEVRYIIS
jgi:predicted AAA+ superfamily ATPase